ncbi:uncharacterized protein LOC108864363 [Galendromus occidentalis]|uniref:Uncharacterized protein LOC108864363 n=1 Tax=Galendromus occidentalis TaxID=34638 RepID=A0AAJ7L4A5_9ACAR|nr:uncharacterized protein LOC108864363 [Galendromus occidentalis]
MSAVNIDELPLEIIEMVLSHLNVYRDYPNTLLVNENFRRATSNLIRRRTTESENQLMLDKAKFSKYRRFSDQQVPPPCAYHRAAVCDSKMLVVSNHVLWTFDLVARKWQRSALAPQSLFAEAVCTYGENVLIFLGASWDQDGDTDETENAVVLYNSKENTLRDVTNLTRAPCRFFVNPTVVGECAILVHYDPETSSAGQSDIFCLDLKTLTWTSESAVSRDQPSELDTMCQIKISENQILYIGATWHGEEVWLLQIGVFFKWKRISVIDEHFAPKKAEYLSKLVRVGENLAVTLAPSENRCGQNSCEVKHLSKKAMSLHMLCFKDLEFDRVRWLRPNTEGSIRGTLTGYSLLSTPFELLLFGGLREDSKGRKSETNSLYTTFLSAEDSPRGTSSPSPRETVPPTSRRE